MDGVCEGNKREEEGECKLREGKHGGEGAAEVNEKMKKGEWCC